MNIACLFQNYTHNRWISLFRCVYIKFYLRTNDRRIKYLRNAGAVIGEGATIHSVATLGSEPFLVEIGDNVYFSGAETRIFTHDGAVMQLHCMGLAPKNWIISGV